MRIVGAIWLALSLGALGLSTLCAPAQCGGVIQLHYNQTPSSNNPIYLQVILSPPAAVQAGAGWRLTGGGDTNFITNSDVVVQLTNNVPQIEFNTNVPGWDPPALPSALLTTNQDVNVISNAPYLVPSIFVVTPFQSLSPTGFAGGPFSPDTLTYTLTNPGQSCTLSWNAGTSANWLSVSSNNGFLPPGASASVTLTVNSQANLLLPGYYPTPVSFACPTPGHSRAFAFSGTLTVAAPTLSASRWLGNGRLAMTLEGAPNRVYSVQFSTNLVIWADAFSVTNSTGTVVFTNPPVSGPTRAFYRAREQL